MNEIKLGLFLTNSGIALIVGLLTFLHNLNKIQYLEKCIMEEGVIIGGIPCYMNGDMFFMFIGLLSIVLGIFGCYYSIRESILE